MGWQDAPVVESPPSGGSWRDAPLLTSDKASYSGASAIPAAVPSAAGAERARLNAQRPQPKEEEPRLLDRITGAIEAARAVGSGLTTGALGYVGGALGGIAGSIASGEFGTDEGLRRAKEAAEQGAAKLTYAPRTKLGQEYTQNIGEAIENTGIQGVPIPELESLGRSITAGRAVTKNLAAATAGEQAARDNVIASGPPQPLAGVGSAATDEALQRVQRSQELPVPIDLTQGQATRDFAQQRFERETAKLPEVGGPLRERYETQNEQMLQNLDAFRDLTQAEQASLRGVGESVVTALAEKQAAKKAEISAAYDAARNAGEMVEPIDVAPIRDYLQNNEPAAINAPVLNSVKQFVDKLDNGSGAIPLNDLEELRKAVGRLSQPGTPNAVYGGDVIRLIDGITQDAGGPLYQQARRMYENYANEFKNRQVINNMLRTKPGTNDRAVAYEDVFDHAILKGSLDDVRAVRRTLQTAGDNGEQAWRELQGQTIQHIKDSVTSNVARDSNGNPVVSPAKLDRIVNALDTDGKLDFIFGKKGAEQIRAVNDIAKDVYTSAPNAVNSSNTASVLIGLLDTAISGTSGLPLPIGTVLHQGVKRIKQRQLVNRVNESLTAPYAEQYRAQKSTGDIVNDALNSVEPYVQQMDQQSQSQNPALQAEIERIRQMQSNPGGQ